MADQISKFLDEHIASGDFPSAVYVVAEKGEVVLHDALGNAVVEPERIAAKTETIYDVASMTKVLVTALLAAMLVEKDVIQTDARVCDFLTEFDRPDKKILTVLDLLTHTSHLPAWLPLYLSALEASQAVSKIAETSLDFNQQSVTYSDLNFIALGAIIERIKGKNLNQLAAQDIFGPLGLTQTFFNPPITVKPTIAASEKGNAFEREMCLEKGYVGSDSDFRRDIIWGEVHDGNAYFMGGVAGHAGLFSTAGETFEVAKQFLPGHTTLLKPETCDLFRTNFTEGKNEDRSFGFQLASTKDSTAGTMSPQSFGHLGFTGTSLWIDPVRDRVFILFTNRTHNHELPFANINSVRRRFHDMAIEFLDKNR